MRGGRAAGVRAATDAIVRVTSDPDGSRTAPKGTLAVDTSSGVTYRNRAGGARWDVVSVPPEFGTYFFHDFFDIAPLTATLVSGGIQNAIADATILGARQSRATALTDAVITRTNVNTWVPGGGKFRFRARVRMPALSDGTNNLVIRIGPGDASTHADHTDGVYLEYDYGTNGNHNWFLCTASNGARTKTSTGIALTANTWTTVEIIINAAGTSVTAYVDGVAAAAAVTTNIPLGSSRTMSAGIFGVFKQLGAGALEAEIDWLEWSEVLSTARSL